MTKIALYPFVTQAQREEKTSVVGDESSKARQSKDRGVTGSLRKSESFLVKVV